MNQGNGQRKRHFLEIDVHTESGHVQVDFSGYANIDNSSQMESRLSEVASMGEGGVLLNFSKLTFISSSGLHVLLKFAKGMADQKRELRLFSLCQEVARVFEISGMVKILDVYPDKERALNSLRS